MSKTVEKIDGHKVFWKAHSGKQEYALGRPEDEILYGGSRGGGKTEGGIVWMVEPKYVGNQRYRGLVIRKNADDLIDWIARAKLMYQPLGVNVVGKPPVLKFPSGAFIRTGHLKDEDAYEKYQGHEYQKILIEELTQIPYERQYEMLISSARSTVDGLKAQVFCTANPGGSGHIWVKMRFVDVADGETYWYANGHKSRIFIRATMDDNPTLMQKDPEYVHQIEAIKDDALRRAWRWGDWDVFAGQFFDKFNKDVHVIKPERLRPEWAKFRCLDWGYSAPAACLWMAVDGDGVCRVYREFYEDGNVPSKCAKRILAMSPEGETIGNTWADPSIWARNQYGRGQGNEQETSESIFEQMMRVGLYCSKANNDRLSGWQKIQDALYWDSNLKPRLLIYENCKNLIRTLPGLVRDKHNVEDLDTDGEDHLADALRYGMMHVYSADGGGWEREKTWAEKILDRVMEGVEVEDNNKGWDEW